MFRSPWKITRARRTDRFRSDFTPRSARRVREAGPWTWRPKARAVILLLGTARRVALRTAQSADQPARPRLGAGDQAPLPLPHARDHRGPAQHAGRRQ